MTTVPESLFIITTVFAYAVTIIVGVNKLKSVFFFDFDWPADLLREDELEQIGC